MLYRLCSIGEKNANLCMIALQSEGKNILSFYETLATDSFLLAIDFKFNSNICSQCFMRFLQREKKRWSYNGQKVIRCFPAKESMFAMKKHMSFLR